MAKDYGVTETGQLPRAWIRGRRETKSHRRASGAKSPLLDTVQNEMRGVLTRLSAVAALRFQDSSNSSEIRA